VVGGDGGSREGWRCYLCFWAVEKGEEKEEMTLVFVFIEQIIMITAIF